MLIHLVTTKVSLYKTRLGVVIYKMYQYFRQIIKIKFVKDITGLHFLPKFIKLIWKISAAIHDSRSNRLTITAAIDTYQFSIVVILAMVFVLFEF